MSLFDDLSFGYAKKRKKGKRKRPSTKSLFGDMFGSSGMKKRKKIVKRVGLGHLIPKFL